MFYRCPTLQLTSAGKEVLKFARQVHQEETNIKAVLVDTLQSNTVDFAVTVDTEAAKLSE